LSWIGSWSSWCWWPGDKAPGATGCIAGFRLAGQLDWRYVGQRTPRDRWHAEASRAVTREHQGRAEDGEDARKRESGGAAAGTAQQVEEGVLARELVARARRAADRLDLGRGVVSAGFHDEAARVARGTEHEQPGQWPARPGEGRGRSVNPPLRVVDDEGVLAAPGTRVAVGARRDGVDRRGVSCACGGRRRSRGRSALPSAAAGVARVTR